MKNKVLLFNHEVWHKCENCGSWYDLRTEDICKDCGKPYSGKINKG